jgi:hypothetical protein
MGRRRASGAARDATRLCQAGWSRRAIGQASDQPGGARRWRGGGQRGALASAAAAVTTEYCTSPGARPPRVLPVPRGRDEASTGWSVPVTGRAGVTIRRDDLPGSRASPSGERSGVLVGSTVPFLSYCWTVTRNTLLPSQQFLCADQLFAVANYRGVVAHSFPPSPPTTPLTNSHDSL